MNTPQALLAAIRAAPDDDAPRLVYADWLEEHGDPERAEFIRVQCELARTPWTDDRLPALITREQGLLARNEADWRAELPKIPGFEWGPFRRGFVESMTVPDVGNLPFEGVYRAVVQIGQNQPWHLRPMLAALTERRGRRPNWHTVALSFVPMQDWPTLVDQAVAARQRATTNEAAEEVIEQAAEQCPEVLHPHLDWLFGASFLSNFGSTAPWHRSGTRHLDFLRKQITQKGPEPALRAWWLMLATRDDRALEVALAEAPGVYRRCGYPDRPYDHWLTIYLEEEGLAAEGDTIRRLHDDNVWHFAFSDGYFPEPESWWRQRIHPTNRELVDLGGPMRFGGSGTGKCGFCKQKLHHALTLDPVPAEVGVTSVPALTLELCLSCLGWEEVFLFYSHDEQGRPLSLGSGPKRTPQFPTGPLRETSVRLGRARPRWQWQRWTSVGQPNLNRVGGPPSWVQSADYPDCLRCSRPMAFLLQLDSGLPLAGGGEWMWGSGGMGYAFWCDACRVSAWHWQCT